ncbi:MAG: hypothetical protein JWN75_1145, partial [Candidatus Saccharibacteria bacterium]|nr:hypothetical protein [Candidatus Saccharibacteria bacterium]
LYAPDTLNRVRFVPKANWNGTDTGLAIPACDQSGATAGATTASITTTGGTSPYSSSTHSASITVTAVDDASVASADSQSVAEDNTAAGNVLANDTDIDSVLAVASFTVAGNATTYSAGQSATIAGIGSLGIAANGNYVFTPLADWNGGVPVVSYTTNTGAVATLAIAVSAVNDAPVASAANPGGLEDAASIAVVLSGTDVDGTVASFTLQGLPANGAVYTDAALSTAAVAGVGYASGSFWFVPVANFNGSTVFSYRVKDDLGASSALATVTINVTSVNDAPVANAASAAALEDAVSMPITLSGGDVDGTIASYTLLNLPANGALFRNAALTLGASAGTAYASASFWFVPAANYNGSTSFDYRVTDDQGATSVAAATVTLAVSSVNDAPIANAVSASGPEDSASIALTLAGNDVDGTIAAYTLQNLPASGLLYTDAALTTLANAGVASASGSLWFVPAANFNGTASFGYKVTDNLGSVSAAAATATITVASVNDAPVAAAVSGTGVEDAGAIAISLAGSDVDGSIASYTPQNLPANGLLYTDAGLVTLAIAGTAYSGGTFWFVPAHDFNGSTTFGFRVVDDQGASSAPATATINVASVNDAPVANAAAASGLEDDGVIAVSLAGNDVDGTIASFTLQGLPANGVLYADSALVTVATAGTPYGSGSFWFVPAANYNGSTSFGYRVTDDQGAVSSTAWASIAVVAVNDSPTALAASASGAEDAGAIAVTLAGSDVDGSIAGFTLQGLPANGTLYTDAALTTAATAGTTYAGGAFWFVPQANFNGSASFAYRVVDDIGAASAAATATFSVAAVNDAPLANATGAAGLEDAAFIAISLSGSDVDGTIAGFTLDNLPGNGTLYTDAGLSTLAVAGTAYASGDFWFVPITQFNGTTTFGYRVTDDLGLVSAASATAAITVGATNDPPVATAINAAGAEDAASIAITLVATDVDNAVQSYTLQSLPVQGVLYVDAGLATAAVVGVAYTSPNFWFVPTPDGNGATTFAYRATDVLGSTSVAAASVTITVNPVNDAPIAAAAGASGLEDAASIAITLGGSDIDGSLATFTLDGLPASGTLFTDATLGSAAVAGTAYASSAFWFVPTADFNGTSSFSYRVTDNLGATSAAAVASFAIAAVNDAPLAANVSAAGLEDAASIAITLAGSDVEGPVASFTLQALPANGVLYTDAALATAAVAGTAYGSGTFWFAPAADFNGTATFSYRVADGQGAASAAAATATITVSSVDDAPVANAASAAGLEDAAAIAVTLSGNDVDGSIASYTLNGLPATGALYSDAALTALATAGTGYASGTFWFVPAANFNGGAGFDYHVTDNLGAVSGSAATAITVTSVNDAPTATAASASGSEDGGAVAITLGGSDVDGGIASFTLLNLPANGGLYRDAGLTLAATAGTAYASGNFWFAPLANFSGASSFTYRVTDNEGATSVAAATATFTITSVNDAPIANAVSASGLEDAASVAISLAGNDVDGSIASYTLAGLPANGVLYADAGLTLAAAAGTAYTSATFWFVPAANYNGTTSFTYRVTDNQGAISTAVAIASITVTSVDDAPLANAAAASGQEDAPSIAITLGGSDVDGTIASFALQNLPAHGALYADAALSTLASAGTAYATGNFWFKPAADYNGSTSFDYRVIDNQGVSSTAMATAILTIAAVNDAPVADAVTVSGVEDAASIALTLAGSDVDGIVAGFTLQALPMNGQLYTDAVLGTLAVVGTTYTSGDFWFVPVANFNGGTSFSYRVTDDQGLACATAAVATINVASVNDNPMALAVTATGQEDAASIAIVLAGTDIDGNVARFTLQSVTLPQDGLLYADGGLTTLAVAGWAYTSGTFWFVPAADFNGSASFTYQVTDDQGASSLAASTASFNVTPVNDAPVPGNVTVTDFEDAASIAVALGGSDIDDNIASYTLQGLPANGTLFSDAGLTTVASAGVAYTGGTFWFVPTANSNGSTTFSYTVTDDGGLASGVAATATIVVVPVNDAPVAAPASATGAEDAAFIAVTLAGSDVDGTVAAFTLQSLPANGALYADAGLTTLAGTGTAYATGTFWFVPAASFNGTAAFSYVAVDNLGATSATGTAVLVVTAVNDAPVANPVGASGAEDATSIPITLAGSDIDAGASIAGFTLQGLPAGGTLYTDATLSLAASAGTMYASGTFYFVPGLDFNGTVSFDFRTTDDQGATSAAAATATIAVTPVNDAPAATAAGGSGLEDAASIAIVLGGSDVDGTIAGVTLQGLPSNGVLYTDSGLNTAAAVGVAYASGNFFFVPTGNFNGGTSFSYQATDNLGALSAPVTATVAVTAVNDAPVPASPAPANVVVPFGATSVSLGLGALNYGVGGGTDEAAQSLSFRLTALPASALGQVALADGTAISLGGSYTLAQIRGLQLLVQPNATGGPATLSFDVIDSGGTANAGNDTLAAQSLQIQFLPNDAPVLAGANALGPLVEDAAADNGISVADLIRGQDSDANLNAASGIAVTAASSPAGGWQFSTDGGASWSSFGAVSDSNARLLGTDAPNRVRFVAAPDFSGTASGLSFRAWDRTGGTASASTADSRTFGADSPFSAQSATASVTVLPVNDAPVRTAVTLAAVAAVEGSSGVSLGLSGLAYGTGGGADEAAQSLTYTVTGLPDAAVGRVVLDDGSTPVAAGASYTLAQLRGMQFAAAPGVSAGSGSFSFQVRDSGGTAGGGDDTLAQRLAISVFNKAPVLNGANAMPTILEDASANAGLRVADLVAGQVSDAGGGYGIAVTAAASTVGEWQYSRDNGTSWQGLAGASSANATLLAADGQTRIRFIPAADWNGDAGVLGFRAWDGSGGTTALLQADARVHGGETPFSDAIATPTLRVLPVNDAPAPAANASVPVAVVVSADGRPASLGLQALAYSAGGGGDEANQALIVTVTAVPDRTAAVVMLADGRTEVVAGGTYTVEQLQGMVVKAAGGGTGQPVELSWLVRDNGGTSAGGADQAAGAIRLNIPAPTFNAAPEPTATPAPLAAPTPAPVA